MNDVSGISADPSASYPRVVWKDWGGDFAAWVDDLLIREGQTFLEDVPAAAALTDESPLNEAYYLRHRIETVWRIWLTARTDALALAAMIGEDYESARSWSEYTAEEMDHDRMFLADLLVHGVTREEVVKTGPLQPTIEMVEYIEQGIREYGALPAVAYSLFVEWNSERFSRRAVQKAEMAFSERHVAGSKFHVGIDLEESHLPVMLGITERLVRSSGNRALLEKLLRDIARFFRAYFVKLHEETNT
ncbi:hypothetical protein [Breoghania sp. JC706]|uniref:hypothetical protein n=1 Tax=Breoghania sp. JC706 TaxID=3117732 RepID=UPI0030096612